MYKEMQNVVKCGYIGGIRGRGLQVTNNQRNLIC